MTDDPKPDRIRERLLECAGSCLDHIRVVRWGEAMAAYMVKDGDYELDVLVRVTCMRRTGSP